MLRCDHCRIKRRAAIHHRRSRIAEFRVGTRSFPQTGITSHFRPSQFVAMSRRGSASRQILERLGTVPEPRWQSALRLGQIVGILHFPYSVGGGLPPGACKTIAASPLSATQLRSAAHPPLAHFNLHAKLGIGSLALKHPEMAVFPQRFQGRIHRESQTPERSHLV